MTKRKTKPPSEEDFAAWRDNPVTQYVMRAYSQAAEDAKAKWIAHSWDAGVCEPSELIENRTLAAAYLDMVDLTYADLIGTLEEPE